MKTVSNPIIYKAVKGPDGSSGPFFENLDDLVRITEISKRDRNQDMIDALTEIEDKGKVTYMADILRFRVLAEDGEFVGIGMSVNGRLMHQEPVFWTNKRFITPESPQKKKGGLLSKLFS